jgi:hypothetical protein
MERNQIAYFRIPGEPYAEFQVGADISFPAPPPPRAHYGLCKRPSVLCDPFSEAPPSRTNEYMACSMTAMPT